MGEMGGVSSFPSVSSTDNRDAADVWRETLRVPSHEIPIVALIKSRILNLPQPSIGTPKNVQTENAHINVEGVIQDIAMEDVASRRLRFDEDDPCVFPSGMLRTTLVQQSAAESVAILPVDYP